MRMLMNNLDEEVAERPRISSSMAEPDARHAIGKPIAPSSKL